MFKKSVFIFFLIAPLTGFTLGLGNITVFSKLNQPLKVQIELINSKSTRLDNIMVKNASLNTYRRANLPRPDTFNQVRFKTKKITNGSIIVELTTKRPVREPFITFIADLKWRTGHINREYTFLLDPAEFIQKQIYTSKSKKKTAAKKTSVLSTPRKVNHRKIDYSNVIAKHIDGDTYKTKHADTLWGIAKRVKPNKNVTSYQTMQALFALNPEAFINNNIDLLKQGQTLKIPTQNEIRQINGKAPLKASSVQANKSSPSSQSTLSKQQKTSQVAESPADTNIQKNLATTKTITHREVVENQAQLKIIPPTEELLNAPVTSKEDLILINRALQNSITTIKSLKNENDVLSRQIKTLSEKLNSLDSDNLSLNDKISDITIQLNQQQNSPTNSTQLQTKQTSGQKSGDGNTQITDATKAAQQSDDNTLAIDSHLTASEQPESFAQKLLNSPAITIILAIFTIIILVAALFTIQNQNKKRKQRKQHAYTPYPVNDNARTPHSFPSEVMHNNNNKIDTASSSSLQGIDIIDENDKEEENENDMDFFEYFEKKINAPEASSSAGSNQKPLPAAAPESRIKAENNGTPEITFDLDISTDEIEAYEKSISKPEAKPSDALFSEIDTYLAYGNYNEAEKLLISELQKTPSDKNLHLKLFETYTLSDKRYEFIQHAENNVNLLNMDMVLRHRIENIFENTWNESLDINKV